MLGNHTPNVDFQLEPPGSITGVLRDTESTLVEWVPVELRRPDGSLLESTVSDATGSYTFSRVPAGSYHLRSGAYDLLAMVRTTDCVESGGVVRVIAEDGRQLSSHPFECRPEGLPQIDMSLSWAEIHVAEAPIGGATHTVRMHAVNPHNEVLGADAKPELLVTGGVPVNPKRLRADGDLDLDVIAEPGQHTLKVEVYVNDQLLDTLSFDVDIPLASPSDVVQSTNDGETGGSGSTGDVVESPDAAPPVASSSGRGGGCAGGGNFGSALWLLGLLLALQLPVYGRLD